MDRGQIDGLQSLRGIAALVVLVHHCSYLYPFEYGWRIAVDIVLNAHAAIVLFFVLSGFVLTRSLLSRTMTMTSVAGFYIKRVFRIYPGLIVATGLCLVFIAVLGALPREGVSEWATSMMPAAVPPLAVVAVAMTGLPLVLRPAYTIVIEMIGSAFLPLLVFIVRRGTAWSVALLVILALVGLSPDLLGARAVYGMFLVDFALGAWAAVALARSRRDSLGHPSVLLLAVVGLVGFRSFFGLVTGSLAPLEVDYHQTISALGEAVFATVLVAGVASVEKSGWLSAAPLQWLGDVSYSVYLVHLPVLFTVAVAISNTPAANWPTGWRFALLLLGTICLTGVLATVIYRLIERPFIEIGRKVAKAIERRPPVILAPTM